MNIFNIFFKGMHGNIESVYYASFVNILLSIPSVIYRKRQNPTVPKRSLRLKVHLIRICFGFLVTNELESRLKCNNGVQRTIPSVTRPLKM